MNSRMVFFMLFFTIVLLTYILVNVYIYKHLTNINFVEFWKILIYKLLFLFIALAYPTGRALERLYPSLFTDVLVKVGSFWLGAMLYLTLFFIAFDVVRSISWAIGYSLNLNTPPLGSISHRFTLPILAVTVTVLAFGYFNALYPRINHQSIATRKHFGNNKNLRIGMASDLHLGTVIANGRLRRFVEMMNGQKPDIILLAGDIFDEDIGPVIKQDMGKLISQLIAPLGVYAVTGNHEFIGGANAAVEYLQMHGVKVLRDTTLLINDSFYIVGREDRQAKYMAGYNRKTVSELVANIDKSKFIVLLDHQPYNLSEAVQNGIDLQLSGHTHHGQLWPFNYLTAAIFKVSKGLKQIENSFLFVSSGFGTWGPPMRIGNRPEIVIFNIEPKQGM